MILYRVQFAVKEDQSLPWIKQKVHAFIKDILHPVEMIYDQYGISVVLDPEETALLQLAYGSQVDQVHEIRIGESAPRTDGL